MEQEHQPGGVGRHEVTKRGRDRRGRVVRAGLRLRVEGLDHPRRPRGGRAVSRGERRRGGGHRDRHPRQGHREWGVAEQRDIARPAVEHLPDRGRVGEDVDPRAAGIRAAAGAGVDRERDRGAGAGGDEVGTQRDVDEVPQVDRARDELEASGAGAERDRVRALTTEQRRAAAQGPAEGAVAVLGRRDGGGHGSVTRGRGGRRRDRPGGGASDGGDLEGGVDRVAAHGDHHGQDHRTGRLGDELGPRGPGIAQQARSGDAPLVGRVGAGLPAPGLTEVYGSPDGHPDEHPGGRDDRGLGRDAHAPTSATTASPAAGGADLRVDGNGREQQGPDEQRREADGRLVHQRDRVVSRDAPTGPAVKGIRRAGGRGGVHGRGRGAMPARARNSRTRASRGSS